MTPLYSCLNVLMWLLPSCTCPTHSYLLHVLPGYGLALTTLREEIFAEFIFADDSTKKYVFCGIYFCGSPTRGKLCGNNFCGSDAR